MNYNSLFFLLAMVFLFACENNENDTQNQKSIESLEVPQSDSISNIDLSGNTNPSKEDELLFEVTIESVFNRYVEATGGKEKLELINSYSQIGKMIVDGESFEMSLLVKGNDKMKLEISSGSKNMMSQIINGNEGVQYQLGQKSTIEKRELITNKLNINMLSCLTLVDYGVIAKLLGNVNFNNESCYVVEFTNEDELYLTEYYSVDTGLKMGSKSEVETPEGIVDVTSFYKNHQEFDGIILPVISEQNAGDQQLIFSIESMKVNTPISDHEFIIE